VAEKSVIDNPLKILVTGASGYIGQHVCMVLTNMGLHIRGLSRSPCPASFQNIEWIQGDIIDPQTMKMAVLGCQCVIHLACLSEVACQKDPKLAFQVNTIGTLNVLEAARQIGVDKFIFTSSGQVYGEQSRLPNRESDLPRPISLYAASKLCGEILCQSYIQTFNLQVIVLRLFNVYGPSIDRTPRHTVETIFWELISQGQPPQILAHPQSGRDFIHIHDVIRSIQLALVTPILNGTTNIINVGTGMLTTLIDLVYIEASLFNRTDLKPTIVETNQKPICFQADPRRAWELLKFKANIPLEKGLLSLTE